jgi:uncharacterized membrane protein
MKTSRWFIALVSTLAAFRLGAAAEGEADRPLRGLTVAFQYPGVTLEPEDTISVDLLVRNRGRKDETVLLELAAVPPGWDAQLKKFSSVVGGVFVAGGAEQTLSLSAKPRAADPVGRAPATTRLPAGSHQFTVKARSPDGVLSDTTELTVTVREKPKGRERISMETSIPELRGPSDDKFVFSLEVRNDTDQDAVFNFRASTPPGWESSFKPAYEQKQIASLQIKANASSTVEMQVTPPYNAKAGEYEFRAEAASPKGRVEKDLKVIITGTYGLKAGTPSGLLSLVTEKGQKANVSIVVQNKGSAPQGEVSLQAFKPENWEVKFEPEKIKNLEPGAFKQVEMKITPAAQALVGDYSVNVQAQGEKASSDVELRVTVKAANTWGWIGIGLIVLVIGGLAAAFKILGRR